MLHKHFWVFDRKEWRYRDVYHPINGFRIGVWMCNCGAEKEVEVKKRELKWK